VFRESAVKNYERFDNSVRDNGLGLTTSRSFDKAFGLDQNYT